MQLSTILLRLDWIVYYTEDNHRFNKGLHDNSGLDLNKDEAIIR